MTLAGAARAILDANWNGRSTVPSRSLYPHQWCWDAAFIAVGWAHANPERGAQELRSILDGQWADGRVPHIVFEPSVPEEAYFPGPAFWRSDTVAGAPPHVRTSGLVQPPLHARAALEVAARSDDPAAILAPLYPRLEAQHAYLGGARDAGGHGVAAIVHPWESGLDNSPAWDSPLDAVRLPAGGVAPYRRRDLVHADPADRPTDAAYDRFIFLARDYRDRGYRDDGSSQFLVEDPLFNAIFLWSTHALAEIAGLLGEDPAPHLVAAQRIHRGLLERLWSPELGRFAPYDVVAGRHVAARTIVSLAPLLDPALPRDRLDALVAELRSPAFQSGRFGVASYDRLADDFDPRRYWRGPVWINTNWLLARGLRRHGHDAAAAAIEKASLELVERSGFREYFDPESGAGYGSDDFSWTAALVLDVLAGD